MRPFRARGSAVKTAGLRLRRGQNPHSSSGQTALYSGRPAGEGIPHTAPLPPCTPSRHCDSRPLRVRQSRRFLETGSLFPPLAALRRFPLPHKTRFAGLLWGAPFGFAEKRKRLLMVSREKTLAAAFRASPGTPFPAFRGRFGGADLSAWTTHPHMQFCRLGALPDAPCSSFAAAVRWLRKTGNVGGKSLRIPGCGSEKRTAGHPGGTPAFATAYAVEWSKPSTSAGPKPP